MLAVARRSVLWIFRNRQTGSVTIAQFPNASLGIFLVASAVHRFVHLAGRPGTLLTVLVTGSLAWWALDEIIRGVNPWRRALGATVLTGLILSHA